MSKSSTIYFPSAHVWVFQKVAERHQVDLAAGTGIDQERLDAMFAGKELIDVETTKKFFDFAIGLTPEGKPPSLHIAETFNLKDLGILGVAMALSKDIRQVLSVFLRFQHVFMPALHFSSEKREFDTSVFFEVNEEFKDYNNFAVEVVVAGTFMLRDHLIAKDVLPESINFAHACDYDESYFTEFFGAPVFFSQEKNEVIFDNIYLDLPLTTTNVSLWHLLMEEVIGNPVVNQTLTTQVQFMIRDGFSKGISITRDKVAEALNMSSRTLSRQLQSEDSNFREIYNEEFIAEAKRLLSQTELPTKAITQELGFSNTAAFSRAFKSVTGLTPTEYRQHHESREHACEDIGQ